MNFKNFKNSKKQRPDKFNVVDSELKRIKKSLGKITDSSSFKYQKLNEQYNALLRKKIRDSKAIIDSETLVAYKQAMLEDLKNNLDQGKVYAASGADTPGESVIYCTPSTLAKAVQEYSHYLSDIFDGVSSEKDIRQVISERRPEVDLNEPYIKLAYSWNETGELDVYSGSDVEDLFPAIDFFARDYQATDTPLSDVFFIDDNDEFGDAKFVTL